MARQVTPAKLLPVRTTIREAVQRDHLRLVQLAAEGAAGGVDSPYLTFVATTGCLLVACRHGRPVAFGGMVPAGGAAMVTDLFVDASARGAGVGGALLRQLLDGYEQRMTCSSRHPGALPAYERAGMRPRWRLLYLTGRAVGGGPPLARAAWRGGRAELVRYYAGRGAIVTADAVVERADPAHDGAATVHRLQAADAVARFEEIRAALPAGTPMRACVPEPHPLARALLERGFHVEDHDLFCATEGVEFPADVSCVHAGLL